MGLWNEKIKDYLLMLEGSIQSIEGIPDDIKQLYKTAWEIPQKTLVQHCIDRQPFVDQGQSFNLYVENLKLNAFNSLMFMAWKGGLKTGKYYIHTRPSAMPQKFTIDPEKQKEMEDYIRKNKKNQSQAFLEPLHDVCDLCSG